LSVVSDSYNIYRCVDEYYGVKFKDQILARDGKWVVRPDSGEPVYVMCGNTAIVDFTADLEKYEGDKEAIELELKGLIKEEVSEYLEDTPHGEMGESDVTITYRVGDDVYSATCEIFWNRHDKQYYFVDEIEDPVITKTELKLEDEGLLNILWRRFGGTINEKGFKVLNPKVGIIWGDGIDAHGIEQIIVAAKKIGFSTENLVFGMGGHLHQRHNRDTQRMAFKCSAQKINGEWITVQKMPLDKTKASKKGKLALVKIDGVFTTLQDVGEEAVEGDYLETVFENGVITKEFSFEEVIANSNK
jgi:nicotinamide phosphoribosyltransferase